MKALCETLGVARSNMAARATGTLSRARGGVVTLTGLQLPA